MTTDGCPFTCPRYQGTAAYYEGMCPQTDSILARTITVNYNRLLRIDEIGLDHLVRSIREVCTELADSAAPGHSPVAMADMG